MRKWKVLQRRVDHVVHSETQKKRNDSAPKGAGALEAVLASNVKEVLGVRHARPLRVACAGLRWVRALTILEHLQRNCT